MLQILLFINCISYVIYINLIATENSFSNLKEINPEYSLKGLILKLKLQYLGHLIQRADSFKTTLMLGKIDGKRRTGATENEMVGWHHLFNRHEFEQALGYSERQGNLACCISSGCKESNTT